MQALMEMMLAAQDEAEKKETLLQEQATVKELKMLMLRAFDEATEKVISAAFELYKQNNGTATIQRLPFSVVHYLLLASKINSVKKDHHAHCPVYCKTN
jgi:hypothetical protein